MNDYQVEPIDKENSTNVDYTDKTLKELRGTQRRSASSPRRSALSKLRDVFSPVKHRTVKKGEKIELPTSDAEKKTSLEVTQDKLVEKEQVAPTKDFDVEIANKIAELNKRLSRTSKQLETPISIHEESVAPSFQYSTVSFRSKTPPKIRIDSCNDDLFQVNRKNSKRSLLITEPVDPKKRRMSSGAPNTKTVISRESRQSDIFQRPMISKALTHKSLTYREICQGQTGPMSIEDMIAYFMFAGQSEANIKSLIHSYRHFGITPKAKFKLLLKYYQEPPPQYLFLNSKLDLRIKVVSYVSVWIQTTKNADFNYEYSGDISDNRVPLRYLNKLIEQAKMDGLDASDFNIPDIEHTTIDASVNNNRRKSTSRRRSSMGTKRQYSISRSNKESLFADPTVFALQMTAYELQMFKSIRSEELLNQSWNKSDSETSAPNISKSIKHFNKLSSWVSREILTTEQTKDQIKKIERFILICRKLKSLGNYNGLMEIISGLSSVDVQRLMSWKQLGEKYTNKFKKIEALMTPLNNFRRYRQKADTIKGLFIPYIGVHLGDIVHLMEGFTEVMKGEYEVAKVMQMGSILGQWRTWQDQEVNIEEDTLYTHFFHNLRE